ncbi:MAG: isochorismatase family protein [Thermoplasmata archaeon]|nr:isochorismatase family protein [Thermoplasmata archaeon]TFG70337.1 MAG: isochorismatase family protein [Methanomassiliicoccus sp.]
MVEGKLVDKAVEWADSVLPYIKRHHGTPQVFQAGKSALLIIDMQKFFLESSSHAYIPLAEPIIENVQRLLRAYRSASNPIVFTRHALCQGESAGAMGRWWGDVVYDEQERSQIIPQLAPQSDEVVLRKTRYNAFVGTDLESILCKWGITSVVITGVMTHLCCETTARDAFVRDFDVYFVIDATATKSEDLHIASLKTLADGFAIPVKTDEVIQWMSAKE